MGAGDVPELGGAVLDPTSGSSQLRCTSRGTQYADPVRRGWIRLLAAEALVPCIFST